MSNRARIVSFAVAAALAAPAGAFAATSQQIFADAADGHLNGTYTKTELNRALKNATVQGYGNPIIKITLKNTINNNSNASSNASTSGCCQARQVFTPPLHPQTPVATAHRAGILPFTGSNLATFVFLGIMLLSGGMLLRWIAGRSHGRSF